MRRRPIAKLNLLAKLAGVKLNWKRVTKNTPNDCRFNGKDIACANLQTQIILHEICHFLVASPKAKRTINFGLGNFVGWNHLPSLYSENQRIDIENKVIALGFHYCIMFNLKFKEISDGLVRYENGKRVKIKKHHILSDMEFDESIIAKFSLEKLCETQTDNSIEIYKYLRGIK